MLSVLVPCWNARGSIGRALASVLDDTDLDLECIVVDDGSTDGTIEVVREIAAHDPRVVPLALPQNAGVSNARNAGLELVRGEWLTLLDADDRFMPGGLARLVEVGVATEALAVVGQQVWSNGRGYTWIGGLQDHADIRTPGRASIVRRPGLLNYVSPHAKLLRRPAFDGLRFEGRVLGDQPWVIRALLRAGEQIEVIGDVVYEWIRTPVRGAGHSITAATRSSARRGVEAIGVAEGALALVIAEAERTVADPAARRRFGAAYVERLLRADLAPHLSRALLRRDAALPQLLQSLEAFLDHVPQHLLSDSDALARAIVEPAARSAILAAPPTRAAVWQLLSKAGQLQPGLPDHGADPLARAALGILARKTGTTGRAVATGLLLASRAVRLPADLPRIARAIRRRLPASPRGRSGS